ETARGADAHGDLAGDERRSQRVAVTPGVEVAAVVLHVLKELQDGHAALVVEGGGGGRRQAPVAVGDVLRVGHGQQLLKVPAVDVVAEAVLAVAGHAAGVLAELRIRARRPLRIQSGFPEHVLVVVQNGVGRVERYGIQLPVDGVVTEQIGDQVLQDFRFTVDELLQRHRGLEVDHPPGADLVNVHQVRRIARLQRQDVLVEQVVVAALVYGLHLDDVLGGVELVDKGGQDVAADGAAQGVPKLNLHLSHGGARQRERQHEHQQSQWDQASLLQEYPSRNRSECRLIPVSLRRLLASPSVSWALTPFKAQARPSDQCPANRPAPDGALSLSGRRRQCRGSPASGTAGTRRWPELSQP